MARNALHVLKRVREAAVIRARRDLAEARAEEQRGSDRLDQHRNLMASEQSAATLAALPDYVAWLPLARSRDGELAAAAVRDQARVARCQGVLAGRRVEAEVVRRALARQEAQQALLRDRKDQAATDEVAGRTRPDFSP